MSPRAVVIGFTSEIQNALCSTFDVVYTVGDNAAANMQWHDLARLDSTLQAPSFAALNDGTFQTLLNTYQRFADINSRRFFLIQAPESEVFNGFVATFYIAHRILTGTKPDVVIFCNLPHEGFDYVFYCLARALGIRTLATSQTLIPERFWFCENIEKFDEILSTPPLFDGEPSNYRLPEAWFYMPTSDRHPNYTLRDAIIETARRPWRLPLAALRYHHSARFRRDQKTARYHAPGAAAQYVYFPLHLQPELTTSSLGGPGGRYSDQVSAIEQLSLLVPEGVWIYIKENPKQTAQQRGPLFYRRLAALPNVRFVPTDLPSVPLIKSSIAVATIIGTVGWEALFHGKPVLTFGNAWYQSFQGITRYRPGLTWTEWIGHTPPPSDQVSASLDELLRRAGRGVVDLDYVRQIDQFDPVENASSVAASIARYWQLSSCLDNKVCI